MKRIGIMLVDDHTVVREGFRRLFELESGFAVIGEADDGRKAVVMAKRLHPSVILMDIAMPLLNGLEATRQIVSANPDAKVLILSAHNDDAYIERAADCGAVGFLLKHTSAQAVCRAIRDVLSGLTHFPAALNRTQAPRSRRRGAYGAVATLTAREMEVFQLVAEGKGNKEVAALLGIRIKTVEKHREHLMAKLKINNIAGLTRYAIGAGIIESGVHLTIN